MTAYHLSPAASQALVDIYVYTHEAWGEQQADKYLDGFYNCFEHIAAKTEHGRPIPAILDIAGHYVRYEHHYIYWKSTANGEVAIAAILHQRMHQIDRLKDTNG